MIKKRIVVHCSDTYAHMDIGAEEIDQWHKARGWEAIGYAAVIRRDGALELGRDLDGDGDVIEETGAHAAGFNPESIGVCMVGGRGDDGKPDPNFTPEQLDVLRWWIEEVKSLPQTDIRDVCGHRDLPGVSKACPSFNVRHWLKTGEIIV